jgi:UDP-glucose:(heptosyl)LPS alpha-1,3-glucosyltransferase
MKIALAHKRLELRGGTERVLYHTATGLRDRGHEVHLFCQEFRISPPPGVYAHEVPGLVRPRTARLLTFGFLAPRIIAKHKCDAVLSFDRIVRQDVFRSGGGPHKMFLEKMIKDAGIWKKWWYRLSPYHRLALSIEKLQLGSYGTGKIIAVCEQIKQEIIDAYAVPEEKIVVIHNGVDHTLFHPRRRLDGGKRLRYRLGIPAHSRVILFVGTGFRRKGLDRLLRLWDVGEFPGIYLLVVGNDAKLSHYRERWDMNKGVIFAGAQANVEDYYAAANLLVLPSIQEAFGNAVLEAMASGLPVITVAGVGAMDKVDGDLKEGILRDPKDSRELKQKILYMLDPLRWPSLSQRARQTAEKYTWEAYFDNLERALSEHCEQSARLSAEERSTIPSFSGLHNAAAPRGWNRP